MERKCAIILPYFGKFNNYFPLFLKSCGKNKKFTWIIYTDDKTKFDYPDNVQVKYMSFYEFQDFVSQKFDFRISLERAYKLCDFRPAYGYIFEDDIKGFEYWGHCDCDLVFGNLDKLLIPIINEGYDKIFAVGHLTLYKNTKENNLLFKSKLNGREIYREFMTSSEGCWFDEDWKDENIHAIFLEKSKKVYTKDLSANPYGDYARFRLRGYDSSERCFKTESYKESLFIWNNGEIIRYYKKGKSEVNSQEYLYMHLQRRKMKMIKSDRFGDYFAIIPNKFVPLKSINDIKVEWKKIRKRHISMLNQPYDKWSKKIIRLFTRICNRFTKNSRSMVKEV